jgi:hypothetical protein
VLLRITHNESQTRIKMNKQIWKRIAVVAGCLFLAFCALELWGKYDFCRGWADHYAARAKQLRAEAASSSLTPDERREHLMAADWHDIISHKFATAARQPWRPYPSHPLITPEEQRMVAAKY